VLCVAAAALSWTLAPAARGTGAATGVPTAATVAVVGSAVKVRPMDPASGTPDASVFAARNEFADFQVVVSAGAQTLSGLTISLSTPIRGPGGSIPSSDVTIYREAYYDVKTPSDLEGAKGRWPDALIPTVDPFFHQARTAFPVDVPAEENRVAWVDVQVPQGQAPGAYDGALQVTGGDGFDVTVPVHLTVLNLTIPTTSSLAGAFGMEWDSPCLAFYAEDCITHEQDGWRTKELFVRAALDDRINVSYPEYQPITPPNERHWFEQYILPLLDGTAPTRLPGARMTAIQVDTGEWLKGWRDEARAKGFEGRSFVYACDEPNRDRGAWRHCKSVASKALQTWPEVAILITGTIDNADRFGATPLVDRLVPIVNEMHDKKGYGSPYQGNQRHDYDAYLQDPRNRLWMYTSCETEGCSGDSSDPYFNGWPGYPIDEPASEARAMGWLSFIYDTSGELYYATDIALTTAWTDQYRFGGNGDGTLFYPGTPDRVGGSDPIPIESMRMKLVRDGYQDYEYLAWLAAHGNRAQAKQVAKGLFPRMYRTNVTDEALQAARAELAGLIG
jgi:Glycoside hydrolase 123 N-terminal domain/Glycoside hydrolase 123, catalytic domain